MFKISNAIRWKGRISYRSRPIERFGVMLLDAVMCYPFPASVILLRWNEEGWSSAAQYHKATVAVSTITKANTSVEYPGRIHFHFNKLS